MFRPKLFYHQHPFRWLSLLFVATYKQQTNTHPLTPLVVVNTHRRLNSRGVSLLVIPSELRVDPMSCDTLCVKKTKKKRKKHNSHKRSEHVRGCKTPYTPRTHRPGCLVSTAKVVATIPWRVETQGLVTILKGGDSKGLVTFLKTSQAKQDLSTHKKWVATHPHHVVGTDRFVSCLQQ